MRNMEAVVAQDNELWSAGVFPARYIERLRQVGGIVAPPLFCQSLTYEEVPADEQRWCAGDLAAIS